RISMLRSAAIRLGSSSAIGRAWSLCCCEARNAVLPQSATSIVAGVTAAGRRRPLTSPIDATGIGHVSDANTEIAANAMAAAHAGFSAWTGTRIELRTAALERAANALERERG